MDSTDPPEIELSAAWHRQAFREPLRTVTGQTVEIVHRGTWSNGFGPDFRDALILFDGRELRAGGVEIHLRTSGWVAHGHARDPRYDDVILHVVLRHDGAETRRSDGALVPVAELGAALADDPVVAGGAVDWTRFGHGPCAADLSRREPGRIRGELHRLGDARLANKAARFESQMAVDPPAEVLFRDLWDGLGYSANRQPMRALAAALSLAAIEDALGTVRWENRAGLARGLLFGAAGFLPIAPSDAALARLDPAAAAETERYWASHGGAWHAAPLRPTAWTRARVRPANHPVARLAAGAALLAGAPGGLLDAVLGPVRVGADPGDVLRALAGRDGAPPLGVDRAAGLVANVVLPFALALAELTGETGLADAAAGVWERLAPGEGNATVSRARRQVAGEIRLPGLGARGQQGLLQLDTTRCAPRRCFECPIAALVIAEQSTAPRETGAR